MSLHPRTKVKTNTPDTPPPAVRSSVFSSLKRWIGRITLLVIGFILLIPLLIYLTAPRYYHVLIIGSDQRSTERARSDVLMLLSVPKSQKDKASLLMIPRDTKVEDEDYGLQKITHFYALWDENTDRLGNRDLTVAHVEELIDTPIQASLEVTFDSFTDIVDLVGGVETSAGFMDGAAAQELVHNRFNKPDGDFGRGAAEREVFKGVLEAAKQPATAKALYGYLTTSERSRLTWKPWSVGRFGLAYLIGHRGKVDVSTIEELVLPGQGERIYTPSFDKSLYYWVINEPSAEEMLNTYVR